MTSLDDYQIIILNDKKYDIIKNSWIDNNQILSLSEIKNNICYPLLAKSKEAIIVSNIPVPQSYYSYDKPIS